jgi:transposase-like protein
MTQPFDFNKALEELKSGKGLTGKDGILIPLIKQLTEAALKAELAELAEHLEKDANPNRKNGSSRKTIKSS